METLLQVSFHQMSHSETLEETIRNKAKTLEKHFDRITGCHVVVEPSSKRHQKTQPLRIRVELTLPQGHIVVSKDSGDMEKPDAHLVVRDAFAALTRKLEEFVDHHYREKRRA